MKAWATDHKPQIIFVAAFVVVFFVGVGVGKFTNTPTPKTSSNYSNYSTKPPSVAKEGLAPVAEPIPAPLVNLTQAAVPEAAAQVLGATTNCVIKGTKSKIYHVKGGAFYERVTKPEKCFATEEEAKSSGYRKSSR